MKYSQLTARFGRQVPKAMIRPSFRAAVLVAIFAFTATGIVGAQNNGNLNGQRITPNFKDAEIGQVIEAVAAANPNTIVVLETGNPVAMPWLDHVKAVVQAWFPGQAGGRAIAEVLAGRVNPSGRLPITFPAGLDQTPRPELPGLGTPWGTPTTITYDEGAEVGYRWFTKNRHQPLVAFGHGLSYATFDHRDLDLVGGDTVTAAVTVHNTVTRDGTDVVQLYLVKAAGEKRCRLLGFERVELSPGQSRRVTIEAEPRLLARYCGDRWRIAGGNYVVAVGKSAADLTVRGEVELPARTFGR